MAEDWVGVLRAFYANYVRAGVEKLWETCGQMAHAPSTVRFVSAMMFAVGEDFALTTDQILELLEREEVPAEGVRRLVSRGTGRKATAGCPSRWHCHAVLNWPKRIVPTLIRVRRTGHQIEELARAMNEWTITIQLDPELYNHIRALVHAELDGQKNRQKIEQLAIKIRAQLDQLSSPVVEELYRKTVESVKQN